MYTSILKLRIYETLIIIIYSLIIMGLIRAIIVTAIIYGILYLIRLKFLESASQETQINCLIWIPLVLIFIYLLL